MILTRQEFAARLGVRPTTAVRASIESADPAEFVAAFGAAAAGNGEVFLCNPQWGVREREQVRRLLEAPPAGPSAQGWLMIPTGGSTGGVRFARHDHSTVGAAVAGFARHFGVDRVNAFGLLPLHHVSGLMGWLRTALTGGVFRSGDWKDIERGNFPALERVPGDWVLSLVPTQLERLLAAPAATDWLRRFRIIHLGGAPAWPALLDRAATARLPLAPGYGMTETAAMVTSLRPEEFLAGARNAGAPLPHARLEIDAEGAIAVSGDSVFRGYYPASDTAGRFVTGDLGEFDSAGRLSVRGRRDGVIITGGEKVHPEEVEAVLRESGELSCVAVLGRPHPEWGQQLVAVFPVGGRPDLDRLRALVASRLAPAKRPKSYVALPVWPETTPGKPDRAALMRQLDGHLRSGGLPAAG